MEVKKLKRVVIKEELYALTKDTIEAIILGQFIYWEEKVKDFDKFIIEEKNRCMNDGVSINIEMQNGWMYKKASEMSEECMLNMSDVTIRRYIQSLIDKGFVECRKNPIHKWDKTLQYRVNISFVVLEIKKLGYDGLSGYSSIYFQNEGMNLQNENSEQKNEAAITEITNIEYRINKEDTNVSKKDKDFLFEECWKLYNRKGSKAKSKTYWNKLTMEEMKLAKYHIQAYVQSVSEKKYQKDFERYLRDKIFNDVVYKDNMIIFDPERENATDNEYRPQLDGFNLHWNEQSKCYISMYDIDMLFDGYNSDNRPSSAIVLKNGIRYKWNTETKKWEEQ